MSLSSNAVDHDKSTLSLVRLVEQLPALALLVWNLFLKMSLVVA